MRVEATGALTFGKSPIKSAPTPTGQKGAVLRSPDLKPRPIFYPESDGQPLAETELHMDLLVESKEALKHYFRDDPAIYVGGSIFLYYVEGRADLSVSPDCFVAFGVHKGKRRTYKLWEEGAPPSLVIELTSRKTHREDLGPKREVYARLGVTEYFLFDPEGLCFCPQLQLFRLVDGAYEHVLPHARDDGWLSLPSAVLGLEVRTRKDALRWWDPTTAQPLSIPTLDFASTLDRLHATEVDARQAHEELARLRAELESLRKETGEGPPDSSPR